MSVKVTSFSIRTAYELWWWVCRHQDGGDCTLLCESRDIVIVRDYHVSVSDNERMSSQTSKWLLSKTLTRLIHKSATSVVSYLIYSVNLIKHRQTLIVLMNIHDRCSLLNIYNKIIYNSKVSYCLRHRLVHFHNNNNTFTLFLGPNKVSVAYSLSICKSNFIKCFA